MPLANEAGYTFLFKQHKDTKRKKKTEFLSIPTEKENRITKIYAIPNESYSNCCRYRQSRQWMRNLIDYFNFSPFLHFKKKTINTIL